MSPLFWIILSTLAIALFSLVGLLTLFLKENLLKKIIFPLVAFSAGALLAGAFLHLLPEAIEKHGPKLGVFLWLLFGFLFFFVLEYFIHWHHCHKLPSEHKKPVTYLILVADAVHNFIDGIAIASAFVVNIKLGLVAWLAIASHEIPQELGDFGILIHGGWPRKKALIFNFLSAFTVILGGLFAYFLATKINTSFLLSFAAGSFIYISASDLIPEIKNNENLKENIIHFLSFLFGILLILLVKLIFD
ncbi:ZIP family metal transporter [Patescibacteria group bacterium]|nr:ZIP family metal transporter [Patescibacteria group bacterium]